MKSRTLRKVLLSDIEAQSMEIQTVQSIHITQYLPWNTENCETPSWREDFSHYPYRIWNIFKDV